MQSHEDLQPSQMVDLGAVFICFAFFVGLSTGFAPVTIHQVLQIDSEWLSGIAVLSAALGCYLMVCGLCLGDFGLTKHRNPRN